MRIVKPRAVFNLLPKGALPGTYEKLVKLDMPHGPYGDEVGMGLTLLEIFLLIAIARKVQAQRVFEFGTDQGATTRALASNVPGVFICTIDLSRCPQKLPVNVLASVSDSRKLVPLRGVEDLVFVDGGHEPDVFENDTRLAYRMIKLGGVIVWHDCGNPEFPHIEEYLQSRAVRIASTMLAVEGLPGL